MTARRDSVVNLNVNHHTPGLVHDPLHLGIRRRLTSDEYEFVRPNNKCELFARGGEFWPEEKHE